MVILIVLGVVSIILLAVIYWKVSAKRAKTLGGIVGALYFFTLSMYISLSGLGFYEHNLWDDLVLFLFTVFLIFHLQSSVITYIPYLKNKQDTEVIKGALKHSIFFSIVMAAALILVIILHLRHIYLWQNIPLETIYM